MLTITPRETIIDALKRRQSPVKALIMRYKKSFVAALFFSMLVNMLMLVSPIYMLQVYDRVLTSGSKDTLIALSLICIFLLLFFGILDVLRQRLLVRVGSGLHFDVAEIVFGSVMQGNIKQVQQSNTQAIRDLETIRQFLSSPGVFAFMDAPWAPLFLVMLFLVHPLMGMVGLVAAIVIFSFALLSEFSSRGLFKGAAEYSVAATQFAESSLRNADVLQAMGMFDNLKERWRSKHEPSVGLSSLASDRLGVMLGSSKSFRFMVQVIILGVGAYLVLRQEMTPGVMIAGSIILGRALAPIEQGISAWRSFIQSRVAKARLDELFKMNPPLGDQGISLPVPSALLEVQGVTATVPQGKKAILQNISFTLQPGTATALLGPSGSGKTTLGRLLVGIWPPQIGNVRLDGAEVFFWDAIERGQYVGYLPQDVELFEATIAENIARLGEVNSEKVIEAAQMAGCHNMIMQFPQNYDTELKPGKMLLSAGQRQRIALARALYGQAKLIVLDEPDSNLDTEGEACILKAISVLKSQNCSVLLITHKVRLLQLVDQVIILKDGTISDIGAPQDVLQKYLNTPASGLAKKAGAGAPQIKAPQVGDAS